MKILVINGPNLNLLGTREPDIYGSLTLADIEQELKSLVTEKYSDVELMFFQSNIEGEIVDAIQKAKFEWNCNGILINPAAYTHTSVAIRDAISAVELPTVEVHISNIHQREEFRRNSFVSPVSIGQVVGFGLDSYKLGLIGLLQKL
jgi:3-dehydroquinate dehydratase-2